MIAAHITNKPGKDDGGLSEENFKRRASKRMHMISLHSTQICSGCVTRQECDEVILTCQDLENGGEEEASALDQSEELV